MLVFPGILLSLSFARSYTIAYVNPENPTISILFILFRRKTMKLMRQNTNCFVFVEFDVFMWHTALLFKISGVHSFRFKVKLTLGKKYLNIVVIILKSNIITKYVFFYPKMYL